MHYLLTVFPSLLPISPTENKNKGSPQNKPWLFGYMAVTGVRKSNESVIWERTLCHPPRRQKKVKSEFHRVTKPDVIRCRLRDDVEGILAENTVNQSFDWDLNFN